MAELSNDAPGGSRDSGGGEGFKSRKTDEKKQACCLLF